MILKKLTLQNIRSYVDQTISFPMGITLFEGNIGSGKSTILMAMEFALFGLGSERGGALLRAGAKTGQVRLCFEVDGKEYEAHRSLERKAKSVQQSDCSLETDGTTLQLSASEIKEKILNVLNFNEPPDPKALSVIYRYAIFTPQEEMKAILWMPSDARLQTLRKAFRIEDYRTALDNSSTLAKSIREKSIKLAGQAAGIEVCQAKCKVKTEEIGKCEEELVNLIGEKVNLEERTASLRGEAESLQIRRDLLGGAAREVPLLERQIKDKLNERFSLEDEIEELASETERLQAETEKLGNTRQPTPKTESELKEELKTLRTREREARTTQTVIEAKISDYESVEKNKVCPTCDRPADATEFEEKIKQKKEEKQKASKEVDVCETRIKEIEDLQELLRTFKEAQEKLQNLLEHIQRNNERTRKNHEKIEKLNEHVTEAKERLEKARQQVEQFNRIQAETERATKELKNTELKLKEIEKGISRIQATRDALAHEVSELEKEIYEKEKEKKRAEKLKEYQIWIEDFFRPTLEMIEKHVMLSINQDFNQHFQKWWSMLVEDQSKESRIDEEFTPLVEQDGYEQDTNYLSGGEKTSMALAYRLSLNTIVQKVSTGIRSNLLILDEPTDGFSKEQLFKIREILDQLKCPQVIMVSHERELESFADHVINVEKKDGVSQIKVI